MSTSILDNAQRYYEITENVRQLNKEKRELVLEIKEYMEENDTDIRINDTEVLTLQTRRTRTGSGQAWYIEGFTEFFGGDQSRAIALWEFLQSKKTEKVSTLLKKIQRPIDEPEPDDY